MDFYCKVKLNDGSERMIEEVFQRFISLEWIWEHAFQTCDGCAVFEAFGANDDPYLLYVDLNDPAQKALVRRKDQKVIFTGIERIC